MLSYEYRTKQTRLTFISWCFPVNLKISYQSCTLREEILNDALTKVNIIHDSMFHAQISKSILRK